MNYKKRKTCINFTFGRYITKYKTLYKYKKFSMRTLETFL